MVTKITILKEEIDLPRGMDRWTELDREPLMAIPPNFDGAFTPPGINVKARTYELCRIRNHVSEPVREYLVNVTERRLFEDLISVSDQFISSRVDEEVKKVREIEIPSAIHATEKGMIRYIKMLSWWKRLFNKF